MVATVEASDNKRTTFSSWGNRQRIVAILLVGALLYGSFIAVDGLVLRHWLDASFGMTPDLHIYQERTSLILNGGIIYRDLDIESPPLINYVLLPAQMIGGEWWAYEAYFSFFSIMTALSMYLVMRRWDGYRATLVALLVLVCPFALQDATWGIQDEPMVAFFYILPVLLMLSGRRGASAAAAALGFWIKFLPIIVYPVTLVKLGERREVVKNIGIAVLTSVLIALPFLLLCPIEFLGFPSYYLLGRSGEGSAGMSVINLLGQGGLHIPGTVGAGLTVGVLIISYYLVYRWKLDIWRGAMLTTVMFLSIYPMIRLGYFIFPFAFFSVWAVKDRGILLRLVPMYLALLFGQGLEASGLGLDPSYSWVVGIALVAAGTIIMLDITRLCLQRKSFLDRERREGPASV
ncbi:MAG: hypothetical protein ISF22_02965 [Methanomassiliicoccus sp.]|nr:hypothetical protein [Methanomassiliicoccus sp.]